MFRDILHKINIFFCDDDIEKINVRDSTVIRNNEIHKMYDEILNELGIWPLSCLGTTCMAE